MKKTAIIVLSLLAVTLGHGAVLFSDNFDSYTSGAALPAGTVWKSISNSSGYNSVTVETDSSNVFESGTTNQYLRLRQYTAGGSTSLNAVADLSSAGGLGSIGQISFNFSLAAGTYANTLYMRIGSSNSNGGTAFALAFGSGSTAGKIYSTTGTSISGSTQLSTFNFDTSYQLSIIYNNTANSYSYDGGTVAAYSMDVWLGSTLIGNDLAESGGLSATPGSALSMVNFIGYSSLTTDLGVDNFTVQSVPEPMAMTSFLGGMLLLFGVRRWQRSLSDINA